MAQVRFTETGSASNSGGSLDITPNPGLSGVHGSSIVEFIEIPIPDGNINTLSFRVTGVSPTVPLRKNSYSTVSATNSSSLVVVNPGLTAVSINSGGSLNLKRVTLPAYAERRNNPNSFPSSSQGITIDSRGLGSNGIFYVTVIRSTAPVTEGGIVNSVTTASYTVDVEIDGLVTVVSEPQEPVAPPDTGGGIGGSDAQPDITSTSTGGVDYAITQFIADKSSVTRYEPIKVLLSGTNSGDISIPQSDLTCVPYIIIDARPQFSTGRWLRIGSSGFGNLKPGQKKDDVRTISLAEFGSTGSYSVRARLIVTRYCKRSGSSGPEASPFKGSNGEFQDENNDNNESQITISLVAADASPTSGGGGGRPRPRPGGGGTSLVPVDNTNTQVNCIFTDVQSVQLYGELPSEEFQSDFIETTAQACRVAEKIVWERNHTIEVSCSVPFNPDVFVGLTVKVNYQEADFSILGLIKSVGHTFSTGGAVSTQFIVLATEYIFTSILASTSIAERVDYRQTIDIGASDNLPSF